MNKTERTGSLEEVYPSIEPQMKGCLKCALNYGTYLNPVLCHILVKITDRAALFTHIAIQISLLGKTAFACKMAVSRILFLH